LSRVLEKRISKNKNKKAQVEIKIEGKKEKIFCFFFLNKYITKKIYYN